jgi:multimeric flavodoxin WrbA
MKVFAINGGPRVNGNSTIMLNEFCRGVVDAGFEVDRVYVKDLNINPCRGCLRCNLIKRCSLRSDDWKNLSQKILAADSIVFSSPVYFHHITGDLKKILDRFRSFVNVRLNGEGLIHTPWQFWNKKIVLLMSQGSPDEADAKPAKDLFEFMATILGKGNSFKFLLGKRLVVPGQLKMNESELKDLYQRLKIPLKGLKNDFLSNTVLLNDCYKVGLNLAV